MFTKDEQLANSIDSFAIIFLVIYVIEALIKILSLGFYTYFNDNWNCFDFFLITISIIFQLFIIQENLPIGLVRTASRITRFRRVFRVAKALRSVKFINFFFLGFEIFAEVKDLVSKITLTFPIFFRLMSILIVVIFFFSSIGVEIFAIENKIFDSYSQLAPFKKQFCGQEELKNIGFFNWGSCEYASLDTFWGNNLLLIQVMTGSGWSYLIFEASKRLNSLFFAFLYFDTYHLICQLIVVSLFKGIIWEIFSVVDDTFNSDTVQKEENEDQRKKQLKMQGQDDDLDYDQLMLNGDIPYKSVNQYTITDQTDIISRKKNIRIEKILVTDLSQSNVPLNDINTQSKGKQVDRSSKYQNNVFFKNEVKSEFDLLNNIKDKKHKSVILNKSPVVESSFQRDLKSAKQPHIDFRKVAIVNNLEQSISTIRQNPENGSLYSSGNASICLKFLKQQQPNKDKNGIHNLFINDTQSEAIQEQEKIQIFDMGENLFDQIDLQKIFTQNEVFFRSQKLNQELDNSFGSKPEMFNRNNHLQNAHFAPSKNYFVEQQQNASNNQSVIQSSECSDLNKLVLKKTNSYNNYNNQLQNLNSLQLQKNQSKKDIVTLEMLTFKDVDMTVNMTGDYTINMSPDASPNNRILRKNAQQKLTSNSLFNQPQSDYGQKQSSKNSSCMGLSPIQRLRSVIQKVKKELITNEMFFFKSKFVTYEDFCKNIIEIRKAQGNFENFDEEEEVFQSDDEECISTFIRVVYDDMVGEEKVKGTRKNSVQDLSTQRSLMNRAMLGGTDKKAMKELETNYFQKLYGNVYKDMRETEVLPMIKISSQLTYNLNTILKFEKVPLKTVNNVWFCTTIKNDKIKFIRIREGFWKYHQALFPQNKENIIIGKQILDGFPNQVRIEIDSFINELKQLSHTLNKDSYIIKPKDKYFDVVFTNIYESDFTKTQSKLQKLDYKKINNTNIYMPESYQNRINPQNNNNNGAQIDSDSTLQSEIVKNSIIKNIQFFVLHNKNINRNSTNIQKNDKKNQLNVNYEARRFINEFERQKSDANSGYVSAQKHRENLKQSSNEIMTFAYVVELVKDVQQILQANRENFIFKASELFFERYQMEISNFLDINYNQKIWEENEEDGSPKSLIIDDLKIQKYCSNIEIESQKKKSDDYVIKQQNQSQIIQDAGEEEQEEGKQQERNSQPIQIKQLTENIQKQQKKTFQPVKAFSIDL